jgi:chromosomal replication initiator protein
MIPMVYEIQRAVCEHFGLEKREFLSVCRERRLVRPRQIAMYLAREMTAHSMAEIGRPFGGMDHTTILHGIRNVRALMERFPEVEADVSACRRRVVEIAAERAIELRLAA